MNHHRENSKRMFIGRFWTAVTWLIICCSFSLTTDATMFKSNTDFQTLHHFPSSYSACFITHSGGYRRPSKSTSSATCMQTQSSFMGHVMKKVTMVKQSRHDRHPRRGMQLGMFLGSDGGILGIGAPEVIVTLLVGYFILGPSELYKITKEIGKFIQNFRSLGSEATKSFETAMEDQLQMQEIRKAQRELNDAFSFRRSINVDQDGEVFAESTSTSLKNKSDEEEEVGGNRMDDATMTKKKKRRIKKKSIVENKMPTEEETKIISDIDMASMFPAELEYSPTSMNQMNLTISQQISGDVSSIKTEIEPISVTRTTDLVSNPILVMTTDGETSFNNHTTAAELSSNKIPTNSTTSTAWYKEEQNARFAAQMNGNWNQRILESEEQLSPLAQVMEKLALLEEERERFNQQLEEEFRLRKQNDEKYYQQKRALLEDAAQQISATVYGNEYNL